MVGMHNFSLCSCASWKTPAYTLQGAAYVSHNQQVLSLADPSQGLLKLPNWCLSCLNNILKLPWDWNLLSNWCNLKKNCCCLQGNPFKYEFFDPNLFICSSWSIAVTIPQCQILSISTVAYHPLVYPCHRQDSILLFCVGARDSYSVNMILQESCSCQWSLTCSKLTWGVLATWHTSKDGLVGIVDVPP